MLTIQVKCKDTFLFLWFLFLISNVFKNHFNYCHLFKIFSQLVILDDKSDRLRDPFLWSNSGLTLVRGVGSLRPVTPEWDRSPEFKLPTHKYCWVTPDKNSTIPSSATHKIQRNKDKENKWKNQRINSLNNRAGQNKAKASKFHLSTMNHSCWSNKFMEKSGFGIIFENC